MDHSKLRGRIVEKYGSISAFSNDISISRTALENKLHNRTGISRNDIIEWSALLDISPEEYGAYFFTEKVDNC